MFDAYLAGLHNPDIMEMPYSYAVSFMAMNREYRAAKTRMAMNTEKGEK